ncbi:MAG: MFS transporter [Pseudomonadota bacterium]
MAASIASPASNAQTGDYPRPIVAWAIVAALFVAYIFSFIDRMIIGLLVEPIKADLGLTDTEISLLQGLAFALFYTIAGIPIGRLIDRAGRMKIVAAGITLWSLMTAACASVTNFWQFFLYRMGVGVGEATLSPAAYSIISDSFPRNRLGLAMGVYGLGSAVGAGAAFLIGAAVITLVATSGNVDVPLLGELRAWQVAFLAVGLPGVLVALLFLVLPEPPRLDAAGNTRTEAPSAAPFGEVLSFMRGEWALLTSLLLAVGFVNFAVLAAVSWLPAMLMRAHGVQLVTAGYMAGTALIVGGLIGLIGGGFITDRIGGGAPPGRIKLCTIAIAVGTIGAISFPLAPTPFLASALFTLFFTAAAVTVGAAPAVIQQTTPNRMRATISAAYIFVVNIIGLALGPTAAALVGDTFFPEGDGIRYALAIVCPLAYLLAVILFFWSMRAIRLTWARIEAQAAE